MAPPFFSHLALVGVSFGDGRLHGCGVVRRLKAVVIYLLPCKIEIFVQANFLGAKDDDADELLRVGEKGGEGEVLLHDARNILLDGGHPRAEWGRYEMTSLLNFADISQTG